MVFHLADVPACFDAVWHKYVRGSPGNRRFFRDDDIPFYHATVHPLFLLT